MIYTLLNKIRRFFQYRRLRFNNSLRLFGRLQILQKVDGTDVLVLDESNLIVDAGKLAVLDILMGDSTAHINQMAIGNGNNPPSSPNADDTSLISQIDIKDFSSTTKDSVNKIVEFRAVFRSGDYSPGAFSPEEINEAALVFDDGTLFARKTFSSRDFLIVNNIYLTFIWSVGVA